jgi:hypothetical protein
MQVYKTYVGFEVFTAVTMKNAVFWDVAACGFIIRRRFGETCRLHLQRSNRLTVFLARGITSNLKI